MKLFRSTWATAMFEFNRSLSLQRLAVATVLAGFPPTMVAVIGFSGQSIPISDLLIMVLVSIVAFLSQLLWATPNIYTELEGKSWIFVASRPRGRTALFLGKYLSAVGFSFAVCFISISLCLAIRTYAPPQSMENPFPVWFAMLGVLACICLTYSAVFSLIGTIFHKRAMVFGAAYVILSEGLVANVPALISHLTARFHLQAIAADWLDLLNPRTAELFEEMYGESTVTFHLLCLAFGVVAALSAGAYIVNSREYITADEA